MRHNELSESIVDGIITFDKLSHRERSKTGNYSILEHKR